LNKLQPKHNTNDYGNDGVGSGALWSELTGCYYAPGENRSIILLYLSTGKNEMFS
jgi:hypothetical protein